MQEKLYALVLKAFSNQRELNNRLKPDWHDQGWRYYRAVWTEVAEAIMHTNWAWWKTKVVDKPMSDEQVADMHVELCDILHFGLSLDIVNDVKGGRPTPQRAKDYVDAFKVAPTTEPLDECLEGIVVDAILLKEFNVKKFARACYMAELSFTHLLTYYFAKSVLNQFRWDNGYKLPKDDPKAYVKMWAHAQSPEPKEDNVYLSTIVAGLIAQNTEEQLVDALSDGELHTSLYARLQHFYDSRLQPT